MDITFIEKIDLLLDYSEGKFRRPLSKYRKRMSSKLFVLRVELGW